MDIVEGRTIVGAENAERVAVVTIAIPAGGEVDIDPTWRFVGWLCARDDPGAVESLAVRKAPRVVVNGSDEDGWTVERTR